MASGELEATQVALLAVVDDGFGRHAEQGGDLGGSEGSFFHGSQVGRFQFLCQEPISLGSAEVIPRLGIFGLYLGIPACYGSRSACT